MTLTPLTPSQSISQRAGASIEAEPIRELFDSPIVARKPEDELFYQGHISPPYQSWSYLLGFTHHELIVC